MVFLNPLALYGLLFTIVPILIHLFELRRVKRIEFSNVVFLKQINLKKGSKNKIQRLLVLFFRILLIIFLVLAFANPTRSTTSSDVNVGTANFYIDNSYSMEMIDSEGNELLFNAIESAKGLVESKEFVESKLITNDGSVNTYLSKKEILSKLNVLDYSSNNNYFETIHSRLDRPSTCYIYSDFQRYSFNNFDNLLNDSLNTYYLTKLSSSESSNIYVDSSYLETPIGLPAENKLQLLLKNTGDRPRDGVLVKLLRGKEQIASVSTNFAPQSIELLTFDFALHDAIAGSYTVEIEDPLVTFDNVNYLEVPHSNKLNIRIFYENRRNQFLEQAFSNPDFFNLSSQSISRVEGNYMDADFIILNELETIPSWLIDRFQEMNTPIFVIPSERIDLKSYSILLNNKLVLNEDTLSSMFSTKSLDGPFFDGVFKELTDQMNLPSGRGTYQLTGQSEELIKLNSKMPFLSRVGQFYFLSDPLSKEFTNFPKHSLFLPVLYKLLIHSKRPPRLSYSLDNRVLSFGYDSLFINGKTILKGENGDFLPTFRYNKNVVLMELPDVLNEPGFYHVISDNDTLFTLALNTSKLESEMAFWTDEELDKLAQTTKHIHFTKLSNANSMNLPIGWNEAGIPLWKYALLLALLFMISELVLLRFLK